MSEHPKKNVEETILPEPPGWFATYFHFQSDLDAETFVQTLRKMDPLESTYLRSINPKPPYHFVLRCSYVVGNARNRYAVYIAVAGEIHSIPNMNMCRISGYIKGDDPVELSCVAFIALMVSIIAGLPFLFFTGSILSLYCAGLSLMIYMIIGLMVIIIVKDSRRASRRMLDDFQRLIKEVEANARWTINDEFENLIDPEPSQTPEWKRGDL